MVENKYLVTYKQARLLAIITDLSQTSRAFASHVLEDTYKRMEMIPDRRCSIWFPNKVYHSSWNK